jgi:phosphoribosylaminoimidazole-succinocarboxamide synthase
MAKLPSVVAESALSRFLQSQGLKRVSQGKVRDTYALGDPTILLQVATDRISAFDFVLPAFVPGKGKVLTEMTVFWLKFFGKSYKHHLVAAGSDLDKYLPSKLRGLDDLLVRGLIVEKLDMLPIECVARGYLTGSGWKDYQETGQVCGHILPLGLRDGDRLKVPIFTPATKATTGHDENIDAVGVRKHFGAQCEKLTLELYQLGATYALGRGIIIADTKLEFGRNGVLADEVLTPDSSRFWDKSDYDASRVEGRSPVSRDKQFVRNYLLGLETPFGCQFDKLNPKNREHVNWVDQLVLPDDVLSETSRIYQELAGQLCA